MRVKVKIYVNREKSAQKELCLNKVQVFRNQFDVNTLDFIVTDRYYTQKIYSPYKPSSC